MRKWNLFPDTKHTTYRVQVMVRKMVEFFFFYHTNWTLNIQKNFFLIPKCKIWMNSNFNIQQKRKIKFSVCAIKFRCKKIFPEDSFAFEQLLFYCSKRKIYKSFVRFMNVVRGEKMLDSVFTCGHWLSVE